MIQRDQILSEQRQRIIKHSDKKFWAKFVRTVNGEELSFKVWIDCSSWNNQISNIDEVISFIINLYPEDNTTLNNSNYHLIVDDMYERLATTYPDKNIWIELNNENMGILAKYETRTPSMLLKI
jgi:hypothetical protein